VQRALVFSHLPQQHYIQSDSAWNHYRTVYSHGSSDCSWIL